jgi:hypothetical protein
MRIRCVCFGLTGWRSDPRRTYARFAASGFSAVLLGVGLAGVGGCSSAHGPQADGPRPARRNTALIATAGIPTMVVAWMPPWSHGPPHRLGSHHVHRATQHPPLVRSPTSAVRATIAPRVTARASTAAASPTAPVHSWSFSQHSMTRSVTSADGTTTTTTTTATTRTVDGKTTRTTRTQTTITPPRAGTHRSPAPRLANGHLRTSRHA